MHPSIHTYQNSRKQIRSVDLFRNFILRSFSDILVLFRKVIRKNENKKWNAISKDLHHSCIMLCFHMAIHTETLAKGYPSSWSDLPLCTLI